MTNITTKKLLDIDISDMTMEDVLEFIYTSLQKSSEKYYIVTPNPEIFMISQRDMDYKNVINNAELALPDGVGVMWAGKILGTSLRQRITGVDLLENVCMGAVKRPITVGFFGGKHNVALLTAECLKQKYPGLKVAFAVEDWPSEKGSLTCDILFVALGSPKQENWISENLKDINVRVAIGVGGAFDFVSGRVIRAPKVIRDLGFEWLFRLIRQPWRAKRQYSLMQFVWLVVREKLRN